MKMRGGVKSLGSMSCFAPRKATVWKIKRKKSIPEGAVIVVDPEFLTLQVHWLLRGMIQRSNL